MKQPKNNHDDGFVRVPGPTLVKIKKLAKLQRRSLKDTVALIIDERAAKTKAAY